MMTFSSIVKKKTKQNKNITDDVLGNKPILLIWNTMLQQVLPFKKHQLFILPYVVRGDANASVFESQASFPGIPLRKRLFEVVWYMIWVFGEHPVAVMECCCQDIVSERQRSTLIDYKVDILFSPKTHNSQPSTQYKVCSYAIQNLFLSQWRDK